MDTAPLWGVDTETWITGRSTGSWSDAEARAPGAVVGDYRLLCQVAAGGMGIVFLAEHLHLGREVAVKVLHDRLLNDATMVARFFAEATASALIAHPGVVDVFDSGWFAGGAYLVMEYLRGETLGARLERERYLPVARILDIGIQLGLALAATHAAGVVHRDLKPENIYLVPPPPAGSGEELVKVLDFGVAKLNATAAAAQLGRRGGLLGTPPYMAPEQIAHPHEVDHRCDIYSLGCLLYQLLTGRPPFRGSLFDILVAHSSAPPPPPRSIAPAIPPALEELVLRMMAKAREQRPGSMVEVVCALTGIARNSEAEARSLSVAC